LARVVALSDKVKAASRWCRWGCFKREGEGVVVMVVLLVAEVVDR